MRRNGWFCFHLSGQRMRMIISSRSNRRKASPGLVRIGTSGWHYDSWRGPFFPEALRAKDQLRYYASQFGTAELNGVFYRTPSAEAVQRWYTETGSDFVFAWKASKFITHWKRLKDAANSLALLEDRLSLLREKAGPVLFQLPPNFEADEKRLDAFLDLLTRKHRYCFEFRHPSWYATRILRLLESRNVALCLSDHHDAPAPWERTADFVYVRGLGPGGRYRGRYASSTLGQWVKRVRAWQKRHDIYVYLDNDQKSAAPADARILKQLLDNN